MGYSHLTQVGIFAIITLVPLFILLALILWRIIPGSLGTMLGGLLIYGENSLCYHLIDYHGFSELARDQSTNITIPIIAFALYRGYKKAKKREKEMAEKITESIDKY